MEHAIAAAAAGQEIPRYLKINNFAWVDATVGSSSNLLFNRACRRALKEAGIGTIVNLQARWHARPVSSFRPTSRYLDGRVVHRQQLM